MLDPKLIRNDIDLVATALQKRHFDLDVASLQQLEAERKSLQTKTESLQSERNQISKQIGKAKAAGEDIEPIKQKVDDLKGELTVAEQELTDVQTRLEDVLIRIPNMPADDVPAGKDDKDNVETHRWGQPREFDFTVRDHTELGEALGQIDFETATKISGPRFVIMHKDIARLHRALIQFMLDVHINEHGYQEVYVPYIANRDSMFGVGQLPKFEQDLFKLQDDRGLYLIPTAEATVTNIWRDAIVPDTHELPLKYVCHSPCFRSEAGSYGKDTRGMIRQHQFEKVELVLFCKPDESEELHQQLTSHAEAILQKLQLPYRAMLLCGGDMGFSGARTIDLEVWLPSQGCYREISSCTTFRDFQARRMKARFRNEQGKPELLHTLNGSGLAIGRTLVAILENYQQQDGSVEIPEVLIPYMGGLTRISK